MRAVCLVALALLILPAAASAQTGGSPVVLTADGMPTAGGGYTVNVAPLKDGLTLGVLVEINGVHVGGVTVAPRADGTLDVHIPIPAAAAGGTVSVTVTAGGLPSSLTAPIMP